MLLFIFLHGIKEKRCVEGCGMEEICLTKYSHCTIWGRLSPRLYLLLQEVYFYPFQSLYCRIRDKNFFNYYCHGSVENALALVTILKVQSTLRFGVKLMSSDTTELLKTHANVHILLKRNVLAILRMHH